MNRRSVSHRGFALIDGVVAGIILGTGLAVVLGLVASAVSAQTRGEALQTAAMLADERLSMVLAMGPVRYEDEGETAGTFPPPYERFEFDLSIEPGEAGDPFFVSIEVSWSERDRDAIVIETFIAPRQGDEPDPEREPERQVERG